MPKKKMSTKSRTIIIVVAVAAVAFFGYRWWKERQSAVPPGIAWGNGRIEARLTDVSAREPLRVKEILVNEGDLVKPGQVLGRLDTVTLDAQLAESNARVAASQEQLTVARAAIEKRKFEIELARIETERSKKLLDQNAGSQREYDVRRMALETQTAALAEDQARLLTAQQDVMVAQANVATIEPGSTTPPWCPPSWAACSIA
jgi:HlyD family secretion protein